LTDFSRSFGNGNGGLIVRLYLREGDNRVKILCKWHNRFGGTRYSCLPLDTLDFHRDGPSLLLCRHTPDPYKLEMWARLKFTTMESKHTLGAGVFLPDSRLGLVVFYCTLLGLRSQDDGKPVEDIQDHELKGEDEIFAG
jgi:hypothetical protein